MDSGETVGLEQYNGLRTCEDIEREVMLVLYLAGEILCSWKMKEAA